MGKAQTINNPPSGSVRRFKWTKRILTVIGFLLGVTIVLGILIFVQPLVFLPHEKIEISLPFAEQDDASTGLIPMGEIEQWHNASTGSPDGHPGLDFQWNKETAILAVADGRITAVYKNNEDQFIVEQNLGHYYRSMYQELNRIAPGISPDLEIKKGQIIGFTGNFRTDFSGPLKARGPSGQLHLDFASTSILVGRLCPLGYFDQDSRRRIETIWSRIKESGNYKPEYPDICNGAYKGKEK